MSDNVLKKEFDPRDVNRLRNLITKKHNNSTGIQSGYKKKTDFHKEGDIWEENNKTWTIKNGIKQNITKLDALKELAHAPLFCPECNGLMNHINDKKMYMLHKKCMDCVAKYETELRRLGKYEEYEEEMLKKNALGFINDLEKEYFDFLSQNSTFVTEDGDIEDWSKGKDKEKMKKEFEEFKQKFVKSLK